MLVSSPVNPIKTITLTYNNWTSCPKCNLIVKRCGMSNLFPSAPQTPDGGGVKLTWLVDATPRNVKHLVMLHRSRCKRNSQLFLVFPLFPSVTPGTNQAVWWDGSQSLITVSLKVCGKDNSRATRHRTKKNNNNKKQFAMYMGLASLLIVIKRGRKYTMVLPWRAAIALKQTRKRLGRFVYLTAAGPMGRCTGPDARSCSQWKKSEMLTARESEWKC